MLNQHNTQCTHNTHMRIHTHMHTCALSPWACPVLLSPHPPAQPNVMVRKHKLDVVKALMLWGLPPHVDLTAPGPGPAPGLALPPPGSSQPPPVDGAVPAAVPAQDVTAAAEGAPTVGPAAEAHALPEPAHASSAAAGLQMVRRALELPDPVLQVTMGVHQCMCSVWCVCV